MLHASLVHADLFRSVGVTQQHTHTHNLDPCLHRVFVSGALRTFSKHARAIFNSPVFAVVACQHRICLSFVVVGGPDIRLIIDAAGNQYLYIFVPKSKASWRRSRFRCWTTFCCKKRMDANIREMLQYEPDDLLSQARYVLKVKRQKHLPFL